MKMLVKVVKDGIEYDASTGKRLTPTNLNAIVSMTSGGKREGAGRKPKFKAEEETTTLSFRVPVSKAEEIKAKIEKILKPYQKKKKA